MAESKTTIPGLLPELSARICCLLADRLGLIQDIPVIGHVWPKIMTDLSGDNLRHKAGATWVDMLLRWERSGTVYTCAGGFIDLGHLRDFADLTRQYYWAIVRRRRNRVIEGGTIIPLLKTHGGISGEIILQRELPAGETEDVDLLVSVASSIAYDVSVIYEIQTYGQERIGGRSSSFSPEDLVSNFLGTYVGGRALKRQIASNLELPTSPDDEALAIGFDTAVTDELETLLDQLGVLGVAETIAAFDQIKGRWVADDILPPNFLNVDYVKRRNFGVRPVEPWLVPGLAVPDPETCSDTDFPEDIPRELPAEAVSACLTHYFFESDFFDNLIFLNRDFDEYIDRIRDDARQRYGPDFDQR